MQGTATTNTVGTTQATYNAAAPSVVLSTTLTSTSGRVNGGTVTFTVSNAVSAVAGTATTSGQVNNGYASVTYALPPGLAAGGYSVKAVDNGAPTFLASTSTLDSALTIAKASPTVVATNLIGTASAVDQTINFTATATVKSNGANVNKGSFTIYIDTSDGTTLKLTSSAQNVVNGSVTISVTLPAGFAKGTYVIKAKFTDPSGNYQNFTDGSHTLILS